MAPDFAAGRELVRALAQADALADVTRLSDEDETRVSLGLAGDRAARSGRCSTPTCGLRRRSGGCLVICGWEGERESVDRRRALSAPLLRAGGAAPLGRRPGRAWEHGPLRGPVPARRADRPRLHGRDARDLAHLVAPRRALPRPSAARSSGACAPQGTPGIVMCHLSHAYRDGASLYFTFVARARARRGDRAVAGGEGGGLRGDRRHRRHDHPPPRGRPRPRALHGAPRWARLGLEALRAVKERLDPAGIMNPGKLLPERRLVPARAAAALLLGGLGDARRAGRPRRARRAPGAVLLDRVADELADRRHRGDRDVDEAAPGRRAAGRPTGSRTGRSKSPFSATVIGESG